MALLGKKKAADPAATAPGAGAAPKARKVKAPKAPKSNANKGGTVVGLNIGNAYIKAVEVTSKGGQLAVTGMGVIATPPESYQNGNVLSVTALAGAIRTMWKQAGLSSKATIFSVAGTGSLVVRVIEVPRMTDGELADNMRVDADRYIPFPPSEVVMDFKALRDLPSDPDAPNMEVLLAAAQREIIDLHISVVQKAKLTPRAIDVEPLALARTMQLDLRAQNPLIDYDDVTAVLNIGLTGTEISILRGDIVVFTRSIPNGGGNLTNAIAETMGIPTSDAERLKIERGDALAPAGYGDGGDEDYGFGDFDDGSGQSADFGDGGFGDGGFGDDDFGGDTATVATAAPATAAPTTAATPAPDTAPDTATSGDAAPTSDDPFDLDFFDQGPEQSEPGAGHGQKEDDEEDDMGISFSFDSLDDDLAPTRKDDVTPASPPPPVMASADATPDMDDFDLPDTYLPAMDAPATPAADAAPAMPSAFDFSDFDLPTMETAPTPAASTPAAPTQKLSQEPAPTDDTSESDDAPAPAKPSFGFSDAPATPAPTAPVPAAVAAPAVAAALSFDKSEDEAASVDEQSTEVEPAASSINFAKSDEDAANDETADGDVADVVSLDKGADAAADEPAEDDSFGLDDVFGAASTDDDSAVAVANDGGFDDGSAGGVGDFDVSAIGAASNQGEDFTEFGTGLSQTGEADDATLYTAMQPVLEDLATEVRRSLEFHLGRYPDTTFSRLVLVGGGAKLRNLDEFLAGNLGVPTSVGDPFAHIKVNVPGLPPEFAPTNAPLCAVALGLALRDFIE